MARITSFDRPGVRRVAFRGMVPLGALVNTRLLRGSLHSRVGAGARIGVTVRYVCVCTVPALQRCRHCIIPRCRKVWTNQSLVPRLESSALQRRRRDAADWHSAFFFDCARQASSHLSSRKDLDPFVNIRPGCQDRQEQSHAGAQLGLPNRRIGCVGAVCRSAAAKTVFNGVRCAQCR